ncbi:MAG: hypothetical protein RLZZ361_86 [Cyanobacteriota bacterium]|jgi:hypothetical protein
MSFLNNDFKSGDQSNNSIVDFFQESNKDDLARIADDISEDAKEFFESSISALLGQMPDEIVSTSMTISKTALTHLLFSSMVTGYVAKSVEHKVQLEKLWTSSSKKYNSSVSFDSIFIDPPKINDIDSIM